MIQITLGDEMLPHIAYKKDGVKRSFYTDHNTLFEFIQNNCFQKQTVEKKFDMPVFETPALPPGAVKYMALPDGKVALFMEKKEFKHDVTYHNTSFSQVPYPNLLFVFIFTPQGEKYLLSSKKCFAFKDKVLRDNTELYRFPFSHVQNDGEMCFFFLTELQDLAQMASFIHNWITVSFSDHFYNERDKNKWGWPLRQIFNQTQGQPHFDYEKLYETNLKVNDIAKSIVRSYFPEATEVS